MNARRPSALLPRAVFALGLFGLGAFASGCAGSQPEEVAAATRLRIAYHDFRTQKSFVLGDKDDPEFANLYSKRVDTAGVKITDAEHLRRVVDELAAIDYFDNAGSIGSPEQIAHENPYKFFVVHADGHPYSLYLAKGVAAANKDVAVSMSKAAEIVTRAFNEVPQLQWVDTKGAGEKYYEQEQERLRREAESSGSTGKGGGR